MTGDLSKPCNTDVFPGEKVSQIYPTSFQKSYQHHTKTRSDTGKLQHLLDSAQGKCTCKSWCRPCLWESHDKADVNTADGDWGEGRLQAWSRGQVHASAVKNVPRATIHDLQ